MPNGVRAAFCNVLIWLVEVVVIPIGLPILLGLGIVIERVLSESPGASPPGIADWLTMFSRPELLFLGLICSTLALYDFLRSSRSLGAGPGRGLLHTLVGLCIAAMLVAGGSYGYHIANRILRVGSDANVDLTYGYAISLTLLLVVISGTIRFLLRLIEHHHDSQDSRF
jgi:hypothetical protein